MERLSGLQTKETLSEQEIAARAAETIKQFSHGTKAFEIYQGCTTQSLFSKWIEWNKTALALVSSPLFQCHICKFMSNSSIQVALRADD
jgi:hypothetical protein